MVDLDAHTVAVDVVTVAGVIVFAVHLGASVPVIAQYSVPAIEPVFVIEDVHTDVEIIAERILICLVC